MSFLRCRTAVLALAVMATIYIAAPPAPARAADVSFSFFYSNLSPHGTWLASAEYGQVWQPMEYETGWNPYYDGHWVYTDCGWTWVSDYGWGDLPYHYGTWVMDADFGWVWVPGYVWGPSWVVFRTGPDYIGWAPVAPSFSVGLSFGYNAPYSGSFVFVSSRYFTAPRVRTYIVPRYETNVIINRTRIVNRIEINNNVVVNRGPDLGLVERATGRSVRRYRIEDVRRALPRGDFSRASLRVDTRRMREGGLRVAEPSERGERGRRFDSRDRFDRRRDTDQRDFDRDRQDFRRDRDRRFDQPDRDMDRRDMNRDRRSEDFNDRRDMNRDRRSEDFNDRRDMNRDRRSFDRERPNDRDRETSRPVERTRPNQPDRDRGERYMPTRPYRESQRVAPNEQRRQERPPREQGMSPDQRNRSQAPQDSSRGKKQPRKQKDQNKNSGHGKG